MLDEDIMAYAEVQHHKSSEQNISAREQSRNTRAVFCDSNMFHYMQHVNGFKTPSDSKELRRIAFLLPFRVFFLF
jgi:hypothetical protein